MRLIVGLGNPGRKYQNTRHNTGFLVVDQLKSRISDGFKIFKSDEFMNESGSFVKKLVDRYKIDLNNLYVIHDDLDIRLGEYKIQFGKGPKDHNGILDIEQKLGTKDFWRVRVGVDNRPLDGRPMGEEYVLQNFTEEERKILDKVIKAVCHEIT
jgi:PTH1 family peptidyl-tRNA hydrolase